MFQIFWFVYVQLEFVALLTYTHHSLIHTSSDYIVENDGEAVCLVLSLLSYCWSL